ncbi:hypothetical protein ACM01_32855 [Streptomyces viridochromogenes]|uniref:Uncharacterized protein n=1 Tax=Streptomyces viridochromogenes TaxID=1938 RepID=A0A0J7Z1W6_STRVR|nr:hypothetical protein ACM01_32855 [Streptomyces viridochromogenes]KOG15611.1 hypothetical protein ADK36_28590 [Streptomyces viridochromogenes]KOG15701.1 hypothetical protein ADK35_28780 [Streptomyces viridochromogenes]
MFAWAAVLICVAGCAAGPASPPGPAVPSAPPAPSARTLQRAAAVLTSDATALRRRWRLFNAQQALDQRCMRKLGLRYLITRAGPEPSAGITTADVLGTGSPAGYGVLPTAGEGPQDAPAQDRYVQSLPPAERARYVTALSGRPDQQAALTLPSGDKGAHATGGCSARTQERLYGSVRAAFEDILVPQDVNLLFAGYLAHDRHYKAALGRWQRCMAGQGHRAQSPTALIQSLQHQADRGTDAASLDREQRAAATADRRCDGESGLRATLAARRAAFLRQQPETTLSRLEGVWQLRQQALRRAAWSAPPPR